MENSVFEEVAVKDILKKLKFILNYGVIHIHLYLFVDNLLLFEYLLYTIILCSMRSSKDRLFHCGNIIFSNGAFHKNVF
jgi:hypothetical protein